MTIKISIAQINSSVGDIASNAQKILEITKLANDKGFDLLVTPELSLSGYPPEDLLLRPDFQKECDLQLEILTSQIKGVTLIVGHPCYFEGKLYNAASVIQDGKILSRYFNLRRCLGQCR